MIAHRRRVLLVPLMVLLCACGGCESICGALGFKTYLFSGYDSLALPGQTVQLRASLEKGCFLTDVCHQSIDFYLDGQLYGAARTDDEGMATLEFTPAEPRDYSFLATWQPPDTPPPERLQTDVLVTCRLHDAPLCVVDLDHTLVNATWKQVLGSHAEPMAESPRIMKRLASDYTLVYLTQRPQVLERKSRDWLEGHGYPQGPIFLAHWHDLTRSSGSYKRQVLAEFRKRFDGPAIGIGDKISDARAYDSAGIRPFLIPNTEGLDSQQLRELIEAVAKLPADAQVVENWEQIEQAVYDKRTFPPAAAVEKLKKKLPS